MQPWPGAAAPQEAGLFEIGEKKRLHAKRKRIWDVVMGLWRKK
jgi:hypothetical protein